MAGPDVSTEKPSSPLCDVCGIDDPDDGSMESEEEADGVIHGGTDAIKCAKDSDERNVRQLIDPRKPTKQEVDYHE